jgi:hypothetical protein
VPRFRTMVRSRVIGSTTMARVEGVQFLDDGGESVVHGDLNRHCAISANSHSPSPLAATTPRVSSPTPQCSDSTAAKVGISKAAAQIVGSMEDWWGGCISSDNDYGCREENYGSNRCGDGGNYNDGNNDL